MKLAPKHFLWNFENGIGTITLNRPEKKNPLTFESYAELRDTFRGFKESSDLKVIVIQGAGGNFCSGGDVHEIIGPLTKMDDALLIEFTTMTGDLIKAIMHCPQVVISSIEGICAGAGAAIAMASDLRYGTQESKIAFLFVRVGLAGCDMGACSLLPRIIGHGRAAELLYSGRAISGSEALSVGFYSEVFAKDKLNIEVLKRASDIRNGPTHAHAITKAMLHREWNMDIDAAITAEAEAQARLMKAGDFTRAYEAFARKEKPVFQGN